MRNPQYTGLANSKTLFADALFTFMPHPGTAVYFGYIGNFENLDRARVSSAIITVRAGAPRAARIILGFARDDRGWGIYTVYA